MTTGTSTSAVCRYCRAMVEINTAGELVEHYAGAFLCNGTLTRAPAIQNPSREEITEAWLKSQAYHSND